MNFDELKYRLSDYNKNKIVFVGLGNKQCSDDIAGIEFLNDLIKSRSFIKSNFVYAYTNPENYLCDILLNNPELVVFIDTARNGKESGTISFFSTKEIENAGFCTHTYSIRMIEEYLRLENEIDVLYLGIEPFSTKIGEGISDILKIKLNSFFMS